MLNTYDETFVLRPRDCDLNEKWRPSAILETMQDAAGAHSKLLGCGRDELVKRNIVWVLSRCELHMDRYPAVGEQITVHTFPTPTRICFFPRYYIFTDSRGEMIGKAGSLWLLLDLGTRRMLPPGEVGRILPDNADLPVPIGLPATVDTVEGEEKTLWRKPVYFDLDVNLHVNNTRYADWACDALGVEVMSKYCLETLLANYDAEVLPDQEITLRVYKNGLDYRVAGYCADKMHFELGGKLRER